VIIWSRSHKISVGYPDAPLHQVEVGCGQAGVLDVGEGDDMVDVQSEDAVGADLLDIGYHGGEIGELRPLQLNDVECRSTVLPYPAVERMATLASIDFCFVSKTISDKVPLRTVTAYQNRSRYIETGI
jgi:hypothetical protein